MLRTSLFCLLLLTASIGCFVGCHSIATSFTKGIKEKFRETEKVLRDSVSEDSIAFTSSWVSAMKSAPDSGVKNNLEGMRLSVSQTAAFIDSLRSVVEMLDDDNLNNIKVIKSMFVYQGKADILFSLLDSSYRLAYDMSGGTASQSEIRQMQRELTTTTENRDIIFSSMSPMGTSMLLCSLEMQLYLVGKKSLDR